MDKEDIEIGRQITKNAIALDEALAEILKMEVKRLKLLAKSDNTYEELQKTDNLIKKIIMALTITEEKLRMGIELCSGNGRCSPPT